jgi:hypothetical protein
MTGESIWRWNDVDSEDSTRAQVFVEVGGSGATLESELQFQLFIVTKDSQGNNIARALKVQ